MTEYSFAYLDEQTKRMIRRAILKGLAIPGYQVPFASREMPMPYVWGGGREQRIYALPPFTRVVSLDFEDHPFEASKADHSCGLYGSEDSYLGEVIVDDRGGRSFVCSDTDYCEARRAVGHRGADLAKVAA